MQRPNADEWSPVSRRQALIGLGTVATSGVGVASIMTDTARAQVRVDSFDVADAEFTTDQARPEVVVTVAYDYDAGTEPVDALVFELSVGDTVVSSDRLDTSMTTHNGTTELVGGVTDSEAWSASDFAPAVASSVSRELSIGVRFAVVTSSGGVIADATATDTATVSVSHPQESRLVASVGGDGDIRDASE